MPVLSLFLFLVRPPIEVFQLNFSVFFRSFRLITIRLESSLKLSPGRSAIWPCVSLDDSHSFTRRSVSGSSASLKGITPLLWPDAAAPLACVSDFSPELVCVD